MNGMGGLGLIFGLYGLFFFLTIGGIVAAVWAIVDALGKPEWAWQYAGENRTGYLVVLAVSCFMCQILGWIPALMYFKGAKPRLMAVLASMPPPAQYAPYGYVPWGGASPGAQGFPTPPGAPGNPLHGPPGAGVAPYGAVVPGQPAQPGQPVPPDGAQPGAPGSAADSPTQGPLPEGGSGPQPTDDEWWRQRGGGNPPS